MTDQTKYGAMLAELDGAIGVEPMALDAANEAAEAILLRISAGDVGAPYEPESLRIFGVIKKDAPSWARLRAKLKGSKIGVTTLETEMRGGSNGEASDESLADRLVAMARDRCQFVHDADDEPSAIFEVDGARQVLHVECKAFGDFISHSFYKETDRAPTEAAQRTALATLRGQARFDGKLREINVRIAYTENAYWLDLADEQWRCVRIDAKGWRIVSGSDAPLFTRSASMRPIPAPVRGGDLAALWPLINIPENSRLMVLAWVLECLRPETPHVVMELTGEQGSAKSSTQRFIRMLIDPNQADLRAAPKAVEDVWIQARNAHMVSLENLSHLSPVYQDALCVLATGGGYSTRTLYTNFEESIMSLKKPIALNGISVVVTAQDLLDRSIHVDLPTIRDRLTGGDLTLVLPAFMGNWWAPC